MIDNTNELRLGNYLNNPIDDVVKIDIEDLIGINYNQSYDPITLDEDWLLSLGFEYINMDDRYTFSHESADYVIERQDDWFFVGVKKAGRTDYFVWHIMYVHQIQNLYFALTGKELTASTT